MKTKSKSVGKITSVNGGKTISAEEFDRRFDNGEDISEFLDFKNARAVHPDIQRVNVDLPVWTIRSLDREARRIGVSRQAVIKTWLVERLDQKVKQAA